MWFCDPIGWEVSWLAAADRTIQWACVTRQVHICDTQLLSQTQIIFAPNICFTDMVYICATQMVSRPRPYMRHPTGVTDLGYICCIFLVLQTWAIFATRKYCQTRGPYLRQTAGVTDLDHLCATQLGVVLQKNPNLTSVSSPPLQFVLHSHLQSLM